MDFIVTTNLKSDVFKELKMNQEDMFTTSAIRNYCVKDFDFDKVYYAILKDNELSAFKVIGYSFRNHKYCIQTPNGIFWNDFERTNIFSSIQHYYDFVGGNSKPLEFSYFEIMFEKAKFNDKPMFKKRRMGGYSYDDIFDVNRLAYEWSKNENRPIPSQAYIDVVFYCKNGVYINIVKKDKQYLNYTDCAKDGLSNIEIVDFGNNEMNININVVINPEPKKVVRTLTIIEQ